jgi:CRP/FNR family transcriptional regulator, dissimilatory nitrate respiration regulator
MKQMQQIFHTPEGALAERPTSPLLRSSAATLSARTLQAASARAAIVAGDGPWQRLLGEPPLSPAESQALASVARTRTVPAGGSVFERCQKATALVLAQSGDVALGYRGADGVFHIERPVHGPAWLDQSSAWLDEAHALDARAMTEAVIVELPREAAQTSLERHPALARRLVSSLAREIQALTINTHELMHKDALARFAAWLGQRLESAELSGNSGVIRLDERKRDIASQLAITPETLSRLMRSLTRQGLIAVTGYTVQVLDAAALKRLSAGA